MSEHLIIGKGGNGARPAADSDLIKETTTQNFRADVMETSRSVPVLVDFWAPWCGPCKQLTPILEKAVRQAKGKVRLVKMNIDDHPQIAGQLGIQSIPAVIAFKNGQPLDGSWRLCRKASYGVPRARRGSGGPIRDEALETPRGAAAGLLWRASVSARAAGDPKTSSWRLVALVAWAIWRNRAVSSAGSPPSEKDPQ